MKTFGSLEMGDMIYMLRNYDDKRKNDMLACFSGKMIMINRSVTISILSTV